MKKERYFEPEIEITKFITEDVMAASTETDAVPYSESDDNNDYAIFNIPD